MTKDLFLIISYTVNVISPLIQFQQQLRIFHWQTSSFAEHEAFGKTYEAMDDLVDTFVETYMGRFGRSIPNLTFHILLQPLSADDVVEKSLDGFVDYLKNMEIEISGETDLLNIRDEMLGAVHKLNYLLSLK